MKRPAAVPVRPPPIRKERLILFAELPPGQVAGAAEFLGRIEGVEVAVPKEALSIHIVYDLYEHSQEELEDALQENGFNLDTSLFSKLKRALIYYAEETHRHNLDTPERLLKKSPDAAYTQAWERHPHGDHDETPPEWREYR